MPISLTQFNLLSATKAKSQLLSCCTSENWAQQLTSQRPFITIERLLECSDALWQKMTEADYLQAFAGHPQIGDVSTLQDKYKHTAAVQQTNNLAQMRLIGRLCKHWQMPIKPIWLNLVLFLSFLRRAKLRIKCLNY